MNIKEVVEFLEGEISELEKGIYIFESLHKPRYEGDRKVLENIRAQHLKMVTLIEKENRGETINQEMIRDAIPPQFR